MHLSAEVRALFEAAKSEFVAIGLGTEADFNTFLAIIDGSQTVSTRLNDAYTFGFLTGVSFVPNSSIFLARYKADVRAYQNSGQYTFDSVEGGTIEITPLAMSPLLSGSPAATLYTIAHEAAHAIRAAQFNAAVLPALNQFTAGLDAATTTFDATSALDNYLNTTLLEEVQAALRGFLDVSGLTPLTAADRIAIASLNTSIGYFMDPATGDFLPEVVVSSEGLPSLDEADLLGPVQILRQTPGGWRDYGLAYALSFMAAHNSVPRQHSIDRLAA